MKAELLQYISDTKGYDGAYNDNSSDEIEKALVDYIYSELENYLINRMSDQRVSFRDRCVFKEILEHIGARNGL